MTTLIIRFGKNVYLGAVLTFLIVSLAACSQGRAPEGNETQLGELDAQAGFSGFNITNANVGDFASWAATPGTEVFPGDYNGDGKTDFVVVKRSPSNGWKSIRIAFSNGDGSFTITNEDVGDFASWAATYGPEVGIFPGDYNDDGKTDIALVSGHWKSIPIAFSNGDGNFTITNGHVGEFPNWAATYGIEVFPGDYNADGKTDLALVNRSTNNDGTTIPIAFSNGDGSFSITNGHVGWSARLFEDFPFWAAMDGTKVLPGDYNDDGRTDIALVNWNWNKIPNSIPIAFSNGDGSFTITKEDAGGNFNRWLATSGTEVFLGDFNGGGKTDIALMNRSPSNGWKSIPIAFSAGDGRFFVTNEDVGDFASWAATSGTEVFPGDYNGDGKTDLAVVNRSTSNGWTTIPIAFSILIPVPATDGGEAGNPPPVEEPVDPYQPLPYLPE